MASPSRGSACKSQSVAAAPKPGRRRASFDAGRADADAPAASVAAVPRRNSRLSSLATAFPREPTRHRTKRRRATPGFRRVGLTFAGYPARQRVYRRIAVPARSRAGKGCTTPASWFLFGDRGSRFEKRANLTLTREIRRVAPFAARFADLCDTLRGCCGAVRSSPQGPTDQRPQNSHDRFRSRARMLNRHFSIYLVA